MFAVSKIFWWLAEPSNLVLALLLLGTVLLWTRWRRLGRGLIALVAMIVDIGGGTTEVAVISLGITLMPWTALLIEPLEDRFPKLEQIPADAAGIITLGGAVDQVITAARGQTSLGGGAERLTEFVVLARKYPRMKLVYTGGSGLLFQQDLKETTVARRFFTEIGLDTGQIIYEGDSRNTHENATRTRDLVKPAPGEKWILITSAIHMPRSVGVFRAAGWTIVPYPVDYSTTGNSRYRLFRSFSSGFRNFSRGAHEWIGMLAYWALGRSDRLYPGPDN